MHRVVVTGIGVVSPNGIGRRDFGEAIVEGRSGVSSIESFDTTGLPIKIAGEVKNFDVTPYLGEHKKNAKLMSRAVRFAVGAAALAVEDAGLDTDEARPRPVRRLHGDGDHARSTSASWSARSRRGSGPTAAFDMAEFAQARSESIFPLWLLEAPAEHGGGAHLDPASRDGPEQHDRDGLRRGHPGGGRGVPPDRAGATPT